MNKSNLQLMADHIKNIPQEMFNMKNYRRKNNQEEINCNSVGCVIGHCVQLDPDPENIPRDGYFETIHFYDWSLTFTNIDNENEWSWCFDSSWEKTDNTPTGASKRIEYLINHGLPDDWKKQMNGITKLSY